MIPVYDPRQREELRKRFGLDPVAIRRLRADLLRSFAGLDLALERLPQEMRAAVCELLQPVPLALQAVRESSRDGASKLLFSTRLGDPVETVVLRIASGRSSVCVSSQTGCAGGCLFCATARLGKGVNLDEAEILDQVRQAGERLIREGRRLRNVVFMGMGEPLLNRDPVMGALAQLTDRHGFHLSARHLLVSTLGVPDGIRELAARFPQVGLAVSLHSVRQEVRDLLMPLARRWPLDQLRKALERRQEETGQPVMIEWLMLDALTDTEKDLAALLGWLAGLNAHINLISYNAPEEEGPAGVRTEVALKPTPPHRFEAFLAALKAAGFKATRRYSLGADIGAACGQLAGMQNKR